MPKVSNFDILIDGERIKIIVNYNAKKLFHASLPEKVVRAADNYVNSHHETEAKLIASFKEVVNKYHKLNEKKRKVIVFGFKSTADILMNSRGETRWEGYKKWVPKLFQDTMGDDGYGFIMNFNVYFEVINNGPHYYRIDEDGNMGYDVRIARNERVIEWTQQREDALNQINKSIEEMVKKIVSIVGSEDKFVSLLESNQKLLQ